MSDNIPRLTGGILFGFILEAKKTRTNSRQSYGESQTDGLSEPDIMKSFLEIFTGEALGESKGGTFKKNVSEYKKGEISSSDYLPFDNQAYLRDFQEAVEQNRKDILERMSVFISEKLSEQKLEWFISTIIETICKDETIDDSQDFRVSTKENVPKLELLKNMEVEVEPFLLDVMRYIFVNRIDNTLGKSTFESLFFQDKKNTPWKFNNFELGKSVIGLKVTRYEPNKTIIEEQTDRKVEHEHVKELDSQIEKENIFKTERSESVKQQVLNNPKVVNQYANKIYNIEHVENLN